MQAWLHAGHSTDDQLGDIWALDLTAAQWTKLSDNVDQAKAWHQAHMVDTDQASLKQEFRRRIGDCIINIGLKVKGGRRRYIKSKVQQLGD